MPVARGLAKLLHGTVAAFHVSDDALAPTALVERMKLSAEDAYGLVAEPWCFRDMLTMPT
jgi:hypothetical protein